MSPRARSLVFFAATVALAMVFLRLGVWQVSRLRERRAQNRVAEAARAFPPIRLDDPASAATTPDHQMNNRRVTVTGRYDHAAEVVIRGQSAGGVPGVRIVTPLRPLRGDTAILVQRGFVASGDARRVDLAGLREDGVRVVSGLAISLPDTGVRGDPLEQDGELSWRRVDLPALRSRLPFPLRSWLLLQTPDSGLPTLPRRDDPAILDDGPHLSYAIQWFSFAITALVVGAIVGFRRG
jgi:surfeit locus 1 family protein